MAVNVKMGVDIGGFTAGIKEGQQILKGLNAEMKASEAEFKATGNAEQKLTSQTKTLTSQLNIQKNIAKQAEQALEKMTAAGISPAEKEYQKLYVQMLNAQAGANEAQAALNALGGEAEQAATGADQLSKNLNGISKKLSLDQVISGINSITSGLERAASQAVHLGEVLFNDIMDKARWADDTSTMALMYGIDLETFERMQKLVTNGLDTSVDAMLSSMDRMKKGIGKDSEATMNALKELGLVTTSYGKNGEMFGQLVTEDSMDLFFRAGDALMKMGDAYDKEAAAQAIFGRSWKELVPLFTSYKTVEEYNKALEDTQITSAEDVEKLAELNDKIGELKGNFDTLATDVMAQLAPALTDAANALNGLLTSLLQYLDTPEGQQMLDDLGTAVSGLFDDLGKIDPAAVVQGFTSVMDSVIGGLQWLVENKDSVVNALKAIVIGWGALKLTGGALMIVKLLDGLKSLGLIGGGAAAAAGVEGSLPNVGMFGKSLQDGLRNIVNHTNGFNLGNSAAVGDWFTHNTALGRQLMNAISKVFGGGEVFANEDLMETYWENGLKKNVSDWWNNPMNIFGRGVYEYWLNLFNGTNPQGEIEGGGTFEVTKVPVEPEPVPDSVEMIVQRIGTVNLPVNLVPQDNRSGGGTGIGSMEATYYANGTAYVPHDGLAYLHKGERVQTARDVASRNYSSNLYVESMYMNNGTDAQGLAAAMAAAQKRQMAGFGS